MKRGDAHHLSLQYGPHADVVAGWWDTLTEAEQAGVSYGALELFFAELEASPDSALQDLEQTPWWNFTAYMLEIPQSERLCNWLQYSVADK
jgi:hypothetical protein